MSSGRHKQKVERAPRRLNRLLLPAAGAALVTGTIVGVSVAIPHGEQVAATSSPATSPSARATHVSTYLANRESLLSRSADRTTLKALPKVTDHQVLVAPLNVWPAPREHGDPLDVLPVGTHVAVTGVERDGFAQVVLGRQVRWVNADYLRDHLPKPSPTATPSTDSGSTGSASAPSTTGSILSSAPCATGSSVESGLVPAAVALHRAVCAHFPQVKEYGGYRPDGEHADGHAVDIMVYSDSATGQAIADWVRANASTLDVSDVIWAQHIWTPVRASEGWRLMPDRGSTTANHYDHVHVRVN
ncbi:MAG: SH3 domain-containing protein [Nocardioidaceae bacterium]